MPQVYATWIPRQVDNHRLLLHLSIKTSVKRLSECCGSQSRHSGIVVAIKGHGLQENDPVAPLASNVFSAARYAGLDILRGLDPRAYARGYILPPSSMAR